jgi:hypothetical protein
MPNAHLFARALFALHKESVLKDHACKEPVKSFIRQSSEGPGSGYHLNTHYRSQQAAQIIRNADLRTEAAYHAFCRRRINGITHDHMVPVEVVYAIIVDHKNPSVEEFEKILRCTGHRATITYDDNRRLSRFTVPESFFDSKSNMYFNHLACYIAAGIDGELEPRPNEGWFLRVD